MTALNLSIINLELETFLLFLLSSLVSLEQNGGGEYIYLTAFILGVVKLVGSTIPPLEKEKKKKLKLRQAVKLLMFDKTLVCCDLRPAL